MKRRCERADPKRSTAARDNIDRIIHEWQAMAEECRDNRDTLSYQAPDNDKSNRRLLYNYGDKIRGVWQTLQSMRNVENTALLKTS